MFIAQAYNYRFNNEFNIEECVYSHGDKAVVYSPINAEVLLCKKEFVDFVKALQETDCFDQTLDNYIEQNPDFGSEVVTKLLDMKIILRDEINNDNG
ncbi:hypothetical protein P7F88_20380 [Vibrio hannami]|uniref:hypothetical protein n=1 Tax=Vibrio hannami TaxID=2717094 RepID=UPI00240F7F23|nr:hypothetical protein [Vibrio hannami]MDG3088300.1 hypothetical protein [Vibrio hannami]